MREAHAASALGVDALRRGMTHGKKMHDTRRHLGGGTHETPLLS